MAGHARATPFDWKNPKWEDYGDIRRNLEFLWGKNWLKTACGHIEPENYDLLERQKSNEAMLRFAKNRYEREREKKLNHINDIIDNIRQNKIDPYLNQDKLLEALNSLKAYPDHKNFKRFEEETTNIKFEKKIFGDKIIKTLREFMRSMQILSKYQRQDQHFYRGEPGFYPTSTPSLFRRNKGKPVYETSEEYHLIQRLAAEEPEEFRQDSTLFEKIVRAQHYKAPTRLLDLTTNPLVALYFSCQEGPKQDGYFYIFTLLKNKIPYWNAPSVALHTALICLGKEERLSLLKTENNKEAEQKLRHFAQMDYPALSGSLSVDRESLRYPLPVWPRKSNQRLRAQHGAFLLWGIEEELASFQIIKNATQSGKKRFRKYLIPGDRKAGILKELEQLGISETTLFPELENAALTYGKAIRHKA